MVDVRLFIPFSTRQPVYVQGFEIAGWVPGVLDCFIENEAYETWPDRDYDCYFCKQKVQQMLEKFPEAYRSWPDRQRLLILSWDVDK